MSERVSLRVSVFVKLLAIMLTMAISLLLLVSWFFIVALLPILNSSIEPFVTDYVHVLAAKQFSFEAAKQLADHSDLEVRYEGPAGAWATSERLPPIAQSYPERGHLFLGGRGYHLVPAPDGGTYLFAWTFRRRTITAHNQLLALLLVLMVGTIIVTYMVIRRMLRPLRTLGDGVARLSAGQLDVVLANPTRDEFGALTNAFNEMVCRVRDMIRARDQLLLDVSHELRSPLTRMRVAIELLPEERNRERMAADIAEMEAMIAELLELERLRDGRGIRSERTDLAALVREVVALFDDKPPGARIVSMPREIPIGIDREKIRIVLRNLLENAIKYSLVDSDAVQVSVACDDEHAIVQIVDDGPGVPDEDCATLFEPFFRVNRSRTKSPAGYGLGLSICKRIVEAHGGAIAMQNNTTRGTTFTVTLPCEHAPRQ
jgi:signal transduction histidine kinase